MYARKDEHTSRVHTARVVLREMHMSRGICRLSCTPEDGEIRREMMGGSNSPGRLKAGSDVSTSTPKLDNSWLVCTTFMRNMLSRV